MAKGYLVTAETIEKLRADHEELKTQIKRLQNTVLRRPAAAVGGQAETLALAKTTGTIAGYTTNDDGNPVLEGGEATIQSMDGEGVLVDQLRTVTAYNVDSSDVEADTYVNVSRHFKTGKWLIDQVGSTAAGQTLHRFTLNEDMGTGTAQQAGADLLTLAGVDTGTDVTLLDVNNRFPYALGPATYAHSGTPEQNTITGARGLAIFDGTDYYIVECESIARFCRFKVDQVSGFDTSDATFDAVPIDYGWMDGQNPGPRTINNPQTHCLDPAEYIFSGDDGDYLIARWSDVTGTYWIVQMECPDVSC